MDQSGILNLLIVNLLQTVDAEEDQKSSGIRHNVQRTGMRTTVQGRNLPSALPPKAEIHILKVSILTKLTKPRQCLKDFNQSIPYLIILNSRVYFITVLGLLTHHSMYRPITAVFFIPSGVEICIRREFYKISK